MKYVFGPVPSRRLGQSLGIDTIPLKTCNWNCTYCQLGRTRPVVNCRKDYFPRDEIYREVKHSLERHAETEIDWVTFVGSGEPTLHAGIGWLIREIKKLTGTPIAVITNGSLLYLESVRQSLAAADLVIPSLDAGNPDLYRKINRPHPDVSFDRYIEGLISFRNVFRGQLWVEVMLLEGLNDSEGALKEISGILDRIHADKVHINLPTRPPAEDYVRPPGAEKIINALALLGEKAEVVPHQEDGFILSGYGNLLDNIINVITRHPIGREQLERILRIGAPTQYDKILKGLVNSDKVKLVDRNDRQFWCGSSSFFPNKNGNFRYRNRN